MDLLESKLGAKTKVLFPIFNSRRWHVMQQRFIKSTDLNNRPTNLCVKNKIIMSFYPPCKVAQRLFWPPPQNSGLLSYIHDIEYFGFLLHLCISFTRKKKI